MEYKKRWTITINSIFVLSNQYYYFYISSLTHYAKLFSHLLFLCPLQNNSLHDGYIPTSRLILNPSIQTKKTSHTRRMKSMLMHSFVLDALDTTAADTFSHFEMLIDEHRQMEKDILDTIITPSSTTTLGSSSGAGGGGGGVQRLIVPSRLKRLVPTIGTFFTRLPLRKAFMAYNAKYGITKRRYVCISFNELRHILNLAQIIALIHPSSSSSSSSGSTSSSSSSSSYSRSGGTDENNNTSSMEDTTTQRSLLGPKFGIIASTETTATTTTIEDGNDRVESKEQTSTTTRQHTLQNSVTDGLTEAWTNMTEDEVVMDENKQNHQRQQQQQQRNVLLSSTNTSSTSASSNSGDVDYRDRSESINIEEELESLLPNNATMPGPKLICFDGDQTLYSDGANFEKSPKLAKYLYLLLKHGVSIAVVTAAGYEYQAVKYELRLSGLLAYFKERGLEKEHLERFYIFGGECNYLLQLGRDYHLHAVREDGPGGWINSTKYLVDCPGNWDENAITSLLDKAERSFQTSLLDLNVRGSVIRKKRSVGLIPKMDAKIPREALDETVLRVQTELEEAKVTLPFCAFNGGRDTWVDVGNKRVGVQVLQSYLGVSCEETLHIGDQFLLTGNDFAARSVCPCVWITSPEETTYILKSILRLAGVPLMAYMNTLMVTDGTTATGLKEEHAAVVADGVCGKKVVDFEEAGRRMSGLKMDVYTGEYIK